MFKIGITGGIGSGKSTLCRLFEELGIPVYNSDSRAKSLMSTSLDLKDTIIAAFGSESYLNEELNRQYLAAQVFNSPQKLELLNSIVHPAVKNDFTLWCEQQDAPYVILECAILFEAKFSDAVDKSLCVLSPLPLRIERVISRDGSTKEQIQERIKNQMSDEQIHSLSDYSVVNIELEDLEQAAKVFDKKFKYESQQY